MDKFQYNGYEYKRVKRPGKDGAEILARWQPGTTLLTTFRGQPAVVHGGRIYTQGRNMNPSRPDWARIKKTLSK